MSEYVCVSGWVFVHLHEMLWVFLLVCVTGCGCFLCVYMSVSVFCVIGCQCVDGLLMCMLLCMFIWFCVIRTSVWYS